MYYYPCDGYRSTYMVHAKYDGGSNWSGTSSTDVCTVLNSSWIASVQWVERSMFPRLQAMISPHPRWFLECSFGSVFSGQRSVNNRGASVTPGLLAVCRSLLVKWMLLIAVLVCRNEGMRGFGLSLALLTCFLDFAWITFSSFSLKYLLSLIHSAICVESCLFEMYVTLLAPSKLVFSFAFFLHTWLHQRV